MNTVSSRSHAIFSVILKQQRRDPESDKAELQNLTSKFHFVDLAGSERVSRSYRVGRNIPSYVTDHVSTPIAQENQCTG